MTTNKIDLFGSKWCDLVFDQRNKLYGAYELRKEYAKNIGLAIFFATGFSVVSLSIPMILNLLGDVEIETAIPDTPVDLVDLDNPPVVPPTPPEPLPKSSGSSRPTIEFKPPVIQPDNTITNTDLPPADLVDNDPGLATNADSGSGNQKLGGDVPTEKFDENKPILIASESPQFPGGEDAMYQYLKKISYPALAREVGISGIVYVSFIIGREGKIRDAKILRGIGGGCDQEALRVINSMPAWKPGKQNGQPVSVLLTLPVNFTLKN